MVYICLPILFFLFVQKEAFNESLFTEDQSTLIMVESMVTGRLNLVTVNERLQAGGRERGAEAKVEGQGQ